MADYANIDEIIGKHQTVYDIYFSQADTSGSGIISAIDAGSFLKQSKLSDAVLRQIWDLADSTGKGYLERQSFYIALKLIALAQASIDVKPENLTLDAPAPKLGELQSNMVSLILPNDMWYIKPSAKISFDKTFDSLSPINNKISGARVKPLLLNTGLPIDVLGRIWDLSDIDKDGELDRSEFHISMQLVAKAKEGLTIPEQLPPSLLPFKKSQTAAPFSLPTDSKAWVVTFDEKTKSDISFNILDTDKDGFVTGAEVREVFLQTGLPQLTLANIWNLCDMNQAGKLNIEQYALAMHFVNKKLSTGLDPPIELTPEMIPPSMRPKMPIDDGPKNKDLEELETQVTELQREKLYYEQRASEHDLTTRQKRTELSTLELEMESLYKTLRDREINRSEDQKKLTDYEDRLVKVTSQLAELKRVYESEKAEIESLKFQIANMESNMNNKETDLFKIRNDLQLIKSEKATMDNKLNMRRMNYQELSTSIQAIDIEKQKNKEKLNILKQIQDNSNKLLKEYGVALNSSGKNADAIKRLEDELVQLKDKLKNESFNTSLSNSFQDFGFNALAINKTSVTSPPASTFNNNTDIFAAAFTSFPTQVTSPFNSEVTAANFANFSNTSSNAFDDFASAASAVPAADPFSTAFDPFKDSDPFKSASTQPIDEDAFVNAFDPFKSKAADPFDSADRKKMPPPRPAPPRPQTPNMKPNKKPESAQRPHSSMDFTLNNKLNLFADFDPFAPTQEAPKTTANDQWAAFSSKPSGGNQFDPFA